MSSKTYITIVALALVALTTDAGAQLSGLHLPRFDVVPGQAQGGRGALVRMPAGTIEGVHVIQGGSFECVDPAELPGLADNPCPRSGVRRKSLHLDIGAGNHRDRGDLAFNYDVGDETRIYDGRKHRRIRVHRGGVVLRGRVLACDQRGHCVDVIRAIRRLQSLARAGQ